MDDEAMLCAGRRTTEGVIKRRLNGTLTNGRLSYLLQTLSLLKNAVALWYIYVYILSEYEQDVGDNAKEMLRTIQGHDTATG